MAASDDLRQRRRGTAAADSPGRGGTAGGTVGGTAGGTAGGTLGVQASRRKVSLAVTSLAASLILAGWLGIQIGQLSELETRGPGVRDLEDLRAQIESLHAVIRDQQKQVTALESVGDSIVAGDADTGRRGGPGIPEEGDDQERKGVKGEEEEEGQHPATARNGQRPGTASDLGQEAWRVARELHKQLTAIKTDMRRITGLQEEVSGLRQGLSSLVERADELDAETARRLGAAIAANVESLAELRLAGERAERRSDSLAAEVLELRASQGEAAERLGVLAAGRAALLRAAAGASGAALRLEALRADAAAAERFADELAGRVGVLAGHVGVLEGHVGVLEGHATRADDLAGEVTRRVGGAWRGHPGQD
uniref:Inhibitor of nuclear factor kappa-B kinase-interacting protein n=1 Tax=Petromyzon marinus TaxID=7757 RepID=A0AAJ7TAD4_PETMA|nr:inhibitor of nuclear factor kappa-B kinase-interacting protein [Petromyzon marinus]